LKTYLTIINVISPEYILTNFTSGQAASKMLPVPADGQAAIFKICSK
jgi:hypothetical protein